MKNTLLTNTTFDPDDLYASLSEMFTVGQNDSIDESSAGTEAEDTCNLFTFVVYVLVFGPMCIFGIVGNTLSFLVLQWEKRSHVATFLLQALALVDNLFLITTAVSQVPTAIQIFFNWEAYSKAQPYVVVLIWPFVQITQFQTVWMTVLIAANRYIAICKPYQAHRLCTMTKVRMQVLGMVLFSIFYNIPRFLEARLTSETDELSNVSYITVKDTSMKLSSTYKIVYENVLYCIFVFLVPLVILIWLNVCLIKEILAVRQRARARAMPQGSHEDEGENNLTLVMIVIMSIFVICQTPALLNQLFYYILPYDCNTPYFYYFHLSNLLVSANSSTNFVVYFAFRQQFRDRLKLFCHKKHGNALKQTETWQQDGQTLSVYSKEHHNGGSAV